LDSPAERWRFDWADRQLDQREHVNAAAGIA